MINNDEEHFIQYKEYLKNSSDAITPVLPTKEPKYSLSMGEYEVTSDDESKCDVPVKDESSPIFTTFSNPLFDFNDDFTSSDNESLSNKDILTDNFKVYSNSLFDDEEINSDKIDSHCFNAESDLIESLSNHITFFDYSPKFDYLEEFSGEFMPSSIINEECIKREHEEYISLMEKLLAINSFPHPLENFHANTIIETLPTSPIPVEDSDSLRDIHFLEELLSNDSISLPENESSNFDHHDDPSFPRSPPKPLNVELCVSLASALFAFLMLDTHKCKSSHEKITSPMIPVLVCWGLGYIVATLFFDVVEISIDTIILSYCQNAEEH
nr:choline transporter-like protein 2 [Tanacetum cinerariifolium]